MLERALHAGGALRRQTDVKRHDTELAGLVDWGFAQQWEHTQAIATVDSATALKKVLLRQ